VHGTHAFDEEGEAHEKPKRRADEGDLASDEVKERLHGPGYPEDSGDIDPVGTGHSFLDISNEFRPSVGRIERGEVGDLAVERGHGDLDDHLQDPHGEQVGCHLGRWCHLGVDDAGGLDDGV